MIKSKRIHKLLFVETMRAMPILLLVGTLVMNAEYMCSLVFDNYVYDIVNNCKTLNTPISNVISSYVPEYGIAIMAVWFNISFAIELCWRYKLTLCYFLLELAYRHFFGDYVFGADSIMPYVLIISRIVICSSLLLIIIKFWIDGRTTSVKRDS